MDTEAPSGADPAGRPPASRLEMIFVVFSMLLYSGGFFAFLVGEEQSAPEMRFIWLPVYALIIVFILPHVRQVRQLVVSNWPFLVLVFLCFVSVLWSIEPGVTLRRSVAVGMTTLFALYVAARFDDLGRLRILGWTYGLLAFFSILTALLLPSYGVHSEIHVGAWRGVFPQKNYFGQMMVYASAVFLVLTLLDPANRRKLGAIFLICVALVLLSTSVTALIALVTMLTAATATTFVSRHRALSVVAIYLSLVIGVALTIALVVTPDAVFGAVGRDATLTGRTDIWEPLTDMIQQRFWLGFGYEGFWEDPEGPAWYIRKLLQWDVPSAHNGWAELWLDLGLLGVATFLVTFVGAVYRTLARLRFDVIDANLWPFLFLILFVVFSFSESSILRHNDISWIIYIATIGAYRFQPVPPKPAVYRYRGMADATPLPQGWSAWRQ